MTNGTKILWILLGNVTALWLMLPAAHGAGSQDRHHSATHSTPPSATESHNFSTDSMRHSQADQSSPKPGPAWRTIGGTLKHINGEIYTVEDYEGNQVQLYVSRDTKRLRGQKKVGDRVRAEMTREGFANSIQ